MTNMRNELNPIYLWSNGVCLNSEPNLLCANSFWLTYIDILIDILTYCAEKHWSFVFQGKLFAKMSNIQQIFVNGQIFITKKIFPNGISKFILPNAIVIQSANLDLILLELFNQHSLFLQEDRCVSTNWWWTSSTLLVVRFQQR